MDSYFGSNFYLQADQIQAINPVLILILIPFFNWIVYPVFGKCNLLKKPLQRMVIGMFLAGIAFIAAALVEYGIQTSYMTKNSAPNAIQIVNLAPVDMKVDTTTVASFSQYNFETAEGGNKKFEFSYNNLPSVSNNFHSSNDKNKKNSYFFYADNDKVEFVSLVSSIDDQPIGKSELRVFLLNLNGDDASNYIGTLKLGSVNTILNITNLRDANSNKVGYSEVDFAEYEIIFKNKIQSSLDNSITLRLDNGARNTFILVNNSNKLTIYQFIDVYGNQVNFAYQFIQYFIITSGEIMFSISGLAFAYSQAPESMKAVLQAAWLLTVAFGNLIVVIIAEANFFENQLYEYLLFAGLIFVFAVISGLMSYYYAYNNDSVSPISESSKDKEDEKENSIPTVEDAQLVQMKTLESNE